MVNDMFSEFERLDAVVIGISRDGVESHRRFAGREEAWGTQAAKNDQRRHKDINGSRGTMVQETLRRLPDNETYDFDVSLYAENSSKTAKHR
jgi:alkyl hydroperoxide reductase subunit AhpC